MHGIKFTNLGREKKNKKAIYYTLDAFLASILLMGAVSLIFLTYDQNPTKHEEKIFITQDALNILSTTKISEIQNPYITEQINNGNITNTNLTILEQIGEFWALNKTDKATTLFESMLSPELITNMGLRLSLDDEQIYLKNYTKKDNAFAFNRMISGIVKDAPLTGYSSSAYLKKIRDKKTSSYYYFGGYIGQGNITFYLEDLPSDLTASKILQLYIEGMFEKNFTLYINDTQCINGFPSGIFVTNTTGILSRWNISSCSDLIITPRTKFTIYFDGNVTNSAVAGGFVKVQYRTDTLQQNITLGRSQYFFPEVRGVANLYDSFYVPGTLQKMDIYLHFNSSQQTFLSIGERQINIPSNESDEFLLNNSYLLSLGFDYDQLSRNTVPIRFASYNATTQIATTGNADVVLITDISGSMKHAVDSWGGGDSSPNCMTYMDDSDTRRTRAAVCMDQEFVNIVMNLTGNRVWPVYIKNDRVFFYNDPSSKINVMSNINSYYNDQGDGKTCLACAINLAYDILQNYSSPSRKKFVVLMTDGVPTHCALGSCTSTSTSYGSKSCEGLCDINAANCGNTAAECDACKSNTGAYNNTLFSANRTVINQNVTFYTIGFGPVDDCSLCNQTLGTIAQLGNGTYQRSKNVTELQLIYQNISYEILNKIIQENQSVVVTGNLTHSDIYGDSYINLTYDPIVPSINPGRISVTIQTPLTACNSTVKIPVGIDIIDAKVISYSGTHWSDLLVVNNITVFNLSDYYVPYYRLGDPTVIQVPVDILINGNNTIVMETGDSPENRTGCSTYNSFIYTAMVPSATSRTNVEENNVGCVWQIQYADGDYNNITVPSGYAGEKTCSYRPGNISYDTEDTYDVATYNLLKQLDTENTGIVLVNINNLDLEIITTVISGVPYLWGPSIMRLEAWQ